MSRSSPPPSAADLRAHVADIICAARMGVAVTEWDQEHAQQAIEAVAGACALAWADNRTLVGDPHPTLFDPEGDTPA